MEGGGPNPTDPVWQQVFASPSVPVEVEGARAGGSTPQPPFDPTEPWSDLPELRKVTIAAVAGLVEALREAGVPVRSTGPRRSGLFSGGMVNVTLSVPERLLGQASGIIARHLGRR
ncbi:MAG: hypothetical protein ACYC77_09775 [Coriobacteriia bacterium]